MVRFLKNISFMSFGILFKTILTFLSTTIFIRFIGLEGYAIIGIVSSIFGVILSFDIPNFFCLIKKKDQPNIFSILLNWILISNVLLGIFMTPFIIFLSKYIYKLDFLIGFYFIMLATVLLERINKFMRDFFRSKSNEPIIQKSLMASITFEFLLGLFLLFFFDMGVAAILYSALAGRIIHTITLSPFIGRYAKYSPTFDYRQLLKILAKYNIKEYFVTLSSKLRNNGTLFLGTLILPASGIGALTILLSINDKMLEFYGVLWFHLAPLITSAREKMKQILELNLRLMVHVAIISSIFLLTAGKYIFNLYTGGLLTESYALFILIIYITILTLPMVGNNSMMFIEDINQYYSLRWLTSIVYLALLAPAITYFGVSGIIYLMLLRLVVFETIVWVWASGRVKYSQKSKNYLVFMFFFAMIVLLIHTIGFDLRVFASFTSLALVAAIYISLNWKMILSDMNKLSKI